jgi:hypothetical protein
MSAELGQRYRKTFRMGRSEKNALAEAEAHDCNRELHNSRLFVDKLFINVFAQSTQLNIFVLRQNSLARRQFPTHGTFHARTVAAYVTRITAIVEGKVRLKGRLPLISGA